MLNCYKQFKCVQLHCAGLRKKKRVNFPLRGGISVCRVADAHSKLDLKNTFKKIIRGLKACLSLVNVCITYVSEKEGFHCVFVLFCSPRSYVSTSLWFMAHSYKGILLPCNYIFFCTFLVLFGCIRSTPQHCPSLPLSLLWLSSAGSFPLLSPENVCKKLQNLAPGSSSSQSVMAS